MNRDKLRSAPVKHAPDLDVMITRALPKGMEEGTKLRIEYVYGFELGCYENWCGLWRVSGPSDGIAENPSDWPAKPKYNDSEWLTASHKELTKAVELWIKRFEEMKNG